MSEQAAPSKQVELSVFLHRGTAAAVLVSTDAVEAHADWLPRSLFATIDIGPMGRKLRILIDRRLAEQKGLLGRAGAGQRSFF